MRAAGRAWSTIGPVSTSVKDLRHCARLGHVTYRVSDHSVAALLRGRGQDGADLDRCLRCGDYVQAPAPVATGPLAQAPLVPRGAGIRSVLVLRLLAGERAVRAVALAAAAVGAWALADRANGYAAALARLTQTARPLATQLGLDVNTSHTLHTVEHYLSLPQSSYHALALALAAYGLLELVEAVGLWLGARWGEYFAVAATALFVPLEVFELVHHPTLLKGGAFALNLAAIGYLVWKGRLFGARGGHGGHLAAQRAGSLLVELTAEAEAAQPAAVPAVPEVAEVAGAVPAGPGAQPTGT